MILSNSPDKSTKKPTIWLCRFATRSPICKALASEILMASSQVEKTGDLACYYYRLDKRPVDLWKLPAIQGVEVMRVEFAEAGVHYEEASRWNVTPLERVALEISVLVDATLAVTDVVLKPGIAEGVK